MPRLADWESWNISSWIGRNDLSKPRRPRSEVHVKNMWIFHRDFTEFSHRFSHIISQRCEVICEIIMWNTCETGSTFSHSISQAVMWNTKWKLSMWNTAYKDRLSENSCEIFLPCEIPCGMGVICEKLCEMIIMWNCKGPEKVKEI